MFNTSQFLIIKIVHDIKSNFSGTLSNLTPISGFYVGLYAKHVCNHVLLLFTYEIIATGLDSDYISIHSDPSNYMITDYVITEITVSLVT